MALEGTGFDLGPLFFFVSYRTSAREKRPYHRPKVFAFARSKITRDAFGPFPYRPLHVTIPMLTLRGLTRYIMGELESELDAARELRDEGERLLHQAQIDRAITLEKERRAGG